MDLMVYKKTKLTDEGESFSDAIYRKTKTLEGGQNSRLTVCSWRETISKEPVRAPAIGENYDSS